MRKIFFLLFIILASATYAESPIKHVIFFGDSLTDNGNLYNYVYQEVPKSPPYYQGRFSNGPVWSEYVAQSLKEKMAADNKIYAMGGATAAFHPEDAYAAASTLPLEVDQYLSENTNEDKSNSLFFIWIGSNDYVFGEEPNVEIATQRVIDEISGQISRLIYYGAQNFIILNLPDLSFTPFVRAARTTERLKKLSLLHNEKLAHVIEQLKAAHPEVKFVSVDIEAMFNEVHVDPGKYNQRYHSNIKNLNDSCWQGGYAYHPPVNVAVQNQFQPLFKKLDANSAQTLVAQSPSLAYAKQLSTAYREGSVPCAEPDQYLFWDQMHPTTAVHRILSDIVLEDVAKEFS